MVAFEEFKNGKIWSFGPSETRQELTEIMLHFVFQETIDEFVFLNKPIKSRKMAATQTQISNVQELQLMQVFWIRKCKRLVKNK